MKNKARTVQDHIDALDDAVLALQDAQLATLAWLMAVGRPSSAQLVRELKAEHANVKASRKKLRQVCGKQPKRAGSNGD
jgi:ABC-type transporter Mla subunit MlaD